MRIPRRKKLTMKVSFAYLFGIGLIFLFNYNTPDSTSGIFLTSLISLPFHLFFLTRYDYRYDLPIMIYISMSILRVSVVGLYIAYLFHSGAYLDLSPTFRSGFGSVYFGGLILVIGDFAFLVTCMVFHDRLYRSRISNSQIQIDNRYDLIQKNAVALLILGILLEFSSRFINFRYFGQAFMYCLEYAGPSSLLLLAIYKSYKKKLSFPLTMIVFVYLVAKAISLLSSFWRQNIIMYLLPLGYLLYTGIVKKKKTKRVFLLYIYGILGFVLVNTVFNYVSAKRFLDVHKIETSTFVKIKFLSDALKSSIPFTRSFLENNRLPDEGIWAIFSRSNLYTPSGWVYNNVETYGHKRDMLVGIARAFVPRIFFPKKEAIIPGKELSVELGQGTDVKSVLTSSCYGMSPAYYRNYGWIGVVIGSMLSAILYSILIDFSESRYRTNPISMIIHFSLIIESLRWFESGFYGRLPYFALMLTVFVPGSIIYDKTVLGSRWTYRSTL